MSSTLSDYAHLFGWPALLATLIQPHNRDRGRHELPDAYPPARTGQRYFYRPGKCWVESISGLQIELCDWSPLPEYPED
jgi:hypothetical protein